MKILRKTDLESMEKELQVLGNSDQMKIIGGTDYLEVSGGALVQLDGGVMYVPFGGSGNCVFFSGVTMSTSNVANDAAYQLNGTIHISSNWAANGFSVCDFAHEYGHYLQEREMGTLGYLINVGIPSVESSIVDSGIHHNYQWYEIDATERGNMYLNYYYGWSCN